MFVIRNKGIFDRLVLWWLQQFSIYVFGNVQVYLCVISVQVTGWGVGNVECCLRDSVNVSSTFPGTTGNVDEHRKLC